MSEPIVHVEVGANPADMRSECLSSKICRQMWGKMNNYGIQGGSASSGGSRQLACRLIVGLVAVALVVMLFFFFTLALFAFGVLLVTMLFRIVWPARQLREKMLRETIEGEYSVSLQSAEPARATQITPKDIAPH